MRSATERQPHAATDDSIWRPFVLAALAVALTGGFPLGGAIVIARALGGVSTAWQAGAAQAHGHVQIFGWAGLMVVGVALHFLPRLAGVRLKARRRCIWALGFLVGGLTLRTVGQPLVGVNGAGSAPAILLGLSGLIELAGATIVIGTFRRIVRSDRPRHKQDAFGTVAPFFITGFAIYWLALAINAAGTLLAASNSGGLPAWASRATVGLGLGGFLLPISFAMSARLFPLYFQTAVPRQRLLRVGLALLVLGMAVVLIGDGLGARWAAGIGRIGSAAGVGLAIAGTNVFGPRRELPRRRNRPLTDSLQLHILSAYLWLAVAAVLLLVEGTRALGAPVVALPADATRHAVGAGFVTLLILGVAPHLVAGFARRPARRPCLAWVSLGAGNLATVLRVVPALAGTWLPDPVRSASLALAGPAAVLAVIALAFNLPLWRLDGPRARGRSAGDV